jgi:hypothetical protein
MKVTKVYRGVEVELHSFSSLVQGGGKVSDHFQSPVALLPGEEPPVRTEWEAGWILNFEGRKHFLPMSRIEKQSPGYPARILVTISTTLPRPWKPTEKVIKK